MPLLEAECAAWVVTFKSCLQFLAKIWRANGECDMFRRQISKMGKV